MIYGVPITLMWHIFLLFLFFFFSVIAAYGFHVSCVSCTHVYRRRLCMYICCVAVWAVCVWPLFFCLWKFSIHKQNNSNNNNNNNNDNNNKNSISKIIGVFLLAYTRWVQTTGAHQCTFSSFLFYSFFFIFIYIFTTSKLNLWVIVYGTSFFDKYRHIKMTMQHTDTAQHTQIYCSLSAVCSVIVQWNNCTAIRLICFFLSFFFDFYYGGNTQNV